MNPPFPKDWKYFQFRPPELLRSSSLQPLLVRKVLLFILFTNGCKLDICKNQEWLEAQAENLWPLRRKIASWKKSRKGVVKCEISYYPLLPSISTFLSLHLSFSGLTSKTVQVINDQKSSSSSNISVFFCFGPFISPQSPISPKVSLSSGCRTWKAPSLSAASPVRCDPQCETHHPRIIHTSMSLFWWSSFLGCVKVVSQLWSDFVTSKSALTQWHMTQILKSSSVTGARCDLCHLVPRKSNNIKRTFANDQLLTDFLEA